MKNILLNIGSVFFVILFISGCSQKTVDNKNIKKKETAEIKKIKKSEKKAKKKIFYNEDGRIIYEIISNVNGNIDKYIYKYYNTKQLQRKTRFFNTLKHGKDISYYENGNIAKEAFYKHGKKDGTQLAYYKNGSLQYEVNMLQNNFYGFSKLYYPSGNKKSIVNYNRFSQVIYLKTYQEDGKILKDVRRGSGVENKYYNSGELHFQYTYFKGKKVKFVEYSKDGEVLKENSLN